MAVVERTADLARKLACDALAQATVADDVVEHLASADVLEDHVVVVLVDDHFTHAADVRVVEENRQRRLTEGADLLGGVFGRLFGRGFGRGCGACVWRYSGQDLDGEL